MPWRLFTGLNKMLPHKWYIAGTGNLGMALGELLKNADIAAFGGWLSQNSSVKNIAPVFDIKEHADAQAGVFLCIPDRLIEETAGVLKQKFNVVVHCSGMQPLFPACDAVCWPMQTFSAHVPTVWEDVPVFIESSNPDLKDHLSGLFEKAGSNPIHCSLQQRQTAHLAAVIANNFSNAMFAFAGDLLASKELDPQLLLPIIRQTVEKLNYTSALQGQTGPAIREDFNTVRMQSDMLRENPDWQRLYDVISAAIPVLFKK